MKVILSRKGFDSSYGGCPSPVLPDGTMVSFPIPSSDAFCTYDSLMFRGITYSEMIRQLSGRHYQYCHLDPDLRSAIRAVPYNWRSGFGQVGSAEGHLEKNNVGINDLFMFFGWFRKTEWITAGEKTTLAFPPTEQGQHMLYGYLQVGEILRGDDCKSFPWHPHSQEYESSNNTIYVATDELIIDGFKTGLKGYGTFRYSDELVLTKAGFSRSKWDLPTFFRDVTISYHSKKSFKERYFQSAMRGQEFVISENHNVSEWAKALIMNNAVT